MSTARMLLADVFSNSLLYIRAASRGDSFRKQNAFARAGCEVPIFVDFLRKMANHNYGFWLLVFTEFAHDTRGVPGSPR